MLSSSCRADLARRAEVPHLGSLGIQRQCVLVSQQSASELSDPHHLL